jgi:ATP-dependent Lon protease
MSPMSAESTVVRNYLDWLLSIPWGKAKSKPINLVEAERILDEDHYGLEKVKERILEYLAVQSRTGQPQGPRSSACRPSGRRQDLARPLDRQGHGPRVRAPVSSAACVTRPEIRGHRRTYIGSMPGKDHPVDEEGEGTNAFFLLDEIDKLGADWRGDPSSALLEVLDPRRTTPSATTTWKWTTTCRRSCSSPPRTA